MAKQTNKNSLANLKKLEKGCEAQKGAGRPKGSLSLKTILEKYLQAEIKHTTVEGETLKVPAFDAIVLAQIAKAREGDTPAFRELMDRLEGKPKSSDTLDVTVKKIVVKTPDDKE